MTARIEREEGTEIRLESNKPGPQNMLPKEIPADLITYLETVFPNRLPPEDLPLDRARGREDVIEHLRQTKKELDNPNV